MEKSIGGFLPFERNDGKLYYENLFRYNLGRNAFLEIVKKRNYKLIWLPKYLCACMNDVLKSIDVSIEKYSITESFLPEELRKTSDGEAILIVNYFSTLSADELKPLRKKHKNIILDNTQAFYTRPLKNVDTIYSCRKWFGVPDGAFLSTSLNMKELDRDVSYKRSLHIFGKFDCEDDVFYPIYQNEEKMFSESSPKKMSRLTENMLRGLHYMKIAKIRGENFSALHKLLCKSNRLSYLLNRIYNSPFMYPYIPSVECDVAAVRAFLRQKGIFLPQLWPDAMQEDAYTQYLCDNILFIPIDQRYTQIDMIRVVNELEAALRLAS